MLLSSSYKICNTFCSISTQLETGCSVFVASNSQAGRYARRIHDEKGVTWRNRGPGTIAKGARADEKFIERAIKDNVQKFRDFIEHHLNAALRKAWGM